MEQEFQKERKEKTDGGKSITTYFKKISKNEGCTFPNNENRPPPKNISWNLRTLKIKEL